MSWPLTAVAQLTSVVMGGMTMAATLMVAGVSMVARAGTARVLVPAPNRGRSGKERSHRETDEYPDSSHSFSSFVVAVRWWRHALSLGPSSKHLPAAGVS